MTRRTFCRVALCASSAFLGSCAHFPSLRRPVPVHRELASDAVPTAFAADAPAVPAPERWWEEFGSEELNRLMAEAFAGNLNVARAWARLRQAKALETTAAAEGKLQLFGGADAGTGRSRREANGSSERDSSNSFSLGLSASYELDLWGRIRASSRSAELARQASAQDVQATALGLSASLAQTWIGYRVAQAQLRVVADQIKTGDQYLELLKVRRRKSLAASVDVLQQQLQVASLESALPPIRERAASLALQLCYLLGRPPHMPVELASDDMPHLPATVPLGVPAEMLARRPDIRAAWLRLRAQEWTVAATEAERLPAVSLTGSSSYASATFEKLFENWALNLATSLTAPLMDGGRRKAAVVRAKALADERFLDYRETVLGALHDVADALSSERWKRQYLTRLETELRLATETLGEAQRRYRKGLSDYIPVLSSLSAKQRVELGVVSARADLLRNRVGLNQAVGGQLPLLNPEPGKSTE